MPTTRGVSDAQDRGRPVRQLPDLTGRQVVELQNALLSNADRLLTAALTALRDDNIALSRSPVILALEESGKAIARNLARRSPCTSGGFRLPARPKVSGFVNDRLAPPSEHPSDCAAPPAGRSTMLQQARPDRLACSCAANLSTGGGRLEPRTPAPVRWTTAGYRPIPRRRWLVPGPGRSADAPGRRGAVRRVAAAPAAARPWRCLWPFRRRIGLPPPARVPRPR